MAVNQLEANLEAITRTIAHLESNGYNNENELNELRRERDKILSDLKLI